MMTNSKQGLNVLCICDWTWW